MRQKPGLLECKDKYVGKSGQAARDRADAVYRRIVGAMDALDERTRKTDRLLEETAQARRALIEGADL